VRRKILANACAFVLRANQTTDDIQSGSGDNLWAQKQGASIYKRNGNMLRQSVAVGREAPACE